MFNTQVQRLSSGLRINSAADDPAGLVNSEKYRAQVDGLGQAIRNAKDGINLAQTAEGALDEISTALRSMRTLALHAANTGVNDAASVQADQDQITSLQGTINRIVTNTQFGTRKLLDGSAGVTATTTNAEVSFVSGTSASETGNYNVQVTTAATQGSSRTQSLQVAQVTGDTGDQSAATFPAGLTDGTDDAGDYTLEFSGALLSGNTVSVDITGVAAGGGLAAVKAAIDASDVGQIYGITTTLSGAGNTQSLVFTSTKLSGSGAAQLDVVASGVDAAHAIDAETFTGITDGAAGNPAGDAASPLYATTDASVSSTIRNAETLTFTDGNKVVAVGLSAGTTLTNALTQINDALDDGGIDVTATFNGDQLQFTNGAYGSDDAVDVVVQSSLTGSTTGAAFNLGVGQTQVNVASGANGGTAGVDIAGNYVDTATSTNLAATGSGLTLTGTAGGASGVAVSLSVAGNSTGDHGDVTVTGSSLIMQIGAFADQTATLTIDDMHANKLGVIGSENVSTIDVTSQAGATEALNILDQAISDVSNQRAALGSFQKDTLETTVRNSLVAQQNIRTTESTIRDADIAEETLAFSKAQILQQTGIAMLAQANQAPQQLLALFR